MIARTNRKRTNREQEHIFRWLRIWIEFMNRLSEQDQLKLFNAVSCYGLYGIYPTDLTGEAEKYFVSEIQPELDRQLKRRKEGKKL